MPMLLGRIVVKECCDGLVWIFLLKLSVVLCILIKLFFPSDIIFFVLWLILGCLDPLD
jgi:hypothetical protein